MSTQLALDLYAPPAPTLSNFVDGDNAEALARLRALAAGERSHRFVYLWGASGSGRSHLLAALAGGRTVLGPGTPGAAFATADAFAHDDAGAHDDARAPGAAAAPGDARDPAPRSVIVVDDVERLDAARQEALFHLFNRVQSRAGLALVCAGERPPLALPVREDLRTRLGWGLVFELHLLTDAQKAAALRGAADTRGVVLAPDVVPWLLTHHSRDLRALLAAFDALDRYAFERKRPITLPLLREWLARPAGDDLDRSGTAGKIP